MSIRLLAQDLYRLRREVESLEKRLASAPGAGHDELQARLRGLRAERDRLRAALDGQKDSGLERRNRS
jgi:hypothetical protein